MGNNKKSARSSRGRSNYVKMIQRSQPRAKRSRHDYEGEAAAAAAEKERMKNMPVVAGLLFGGAVGFFVGQPLGYAALGLLTGGIVGAAVGAAFDLVRNKVRGWKARKK